MKLCIVSSSGGHLYKAHLLKNWWSSHQRVWVTKKDDFSQSLLKNEKKHFAYFPENRNAINAIKNFFLAFKILKKEKPNLIFSTGAGVAPPFMLVAKLLKIKTVFMETFIFIDRPTLSGKICYLFVDEFIVQNKKLIKHYPKAKYFGSLVTSTKNKVT